MEWAEWFEANDRHVDYTPLFDTSYVSTVFMGIVSTVFIGIGSPFRDDDVFETMAFNTGTDLDDNAYRTPTWDAAQAMHDQIVAAVKDAVRKKLK